MTNRRNLLLPLATVTVLALAPQSLAATQVLVAKVGPGDACSLKVLTGIGYTRLSSLPRGRYSFRVEDRSNSDNFHLVGPGLDRRTSRAFVGTISWTARLRKGVYAFRSDAHPLKMSGRFRVT
jgi:hypothetical protein